MVLLGILIGWSAKVDQKGVEILGHIDSRFPTPIFPPTVIQSLKDFQNSIQPAIIIAILGFIGNLMQRAPSDSMLKLLPLVPTQESIIVAKHYAGKHHYTVSPNRELVALGSANIVGSFFRIFPSFGSLVRSALGAYCLLCCNPLLSSSVLSEWSAFPIQPIWLERGHSCTI